jgi:uncharacterized protein
VIRRRRALGAVATAAAGCALALPPSRPASAQPRRVDVEPMALPVKQDDTVARGYRRDVLLRWGDRVAYDAPRWEPNFPRPEAAAGQFGWDARVAALAVPQRQAADGVPRAILAVLHPTVDPFMAWPGGGTDRPSVAAAMQGASLLNLERLGSGWVVVDGGYQTRRLHGGTLCRLSGPQAGGGSVQGLLGLQGGCTTPWGTLLLAEGDPAPWIARLGAADRRFASAGGFGWVAELDPFDPGAVPTKRTALGRFGHGDVAATLARDGRAVVYMTDRRANGFLRRFVSSGPATVPGALDAGTISVARFAGGRLDWLPVRPDGDGGQAEGGSPLDTPAGLGLDPTGPRLVLCCHGSPARPRGYALEISATEGDDAAPDATVRTLFVAGLPWEGGQYGPGAARLPRGTAWPENPSAVAVDGRGRAWIGTDRAGVVGAQADGLYVCDLDGPGRGVPLPIYGAPRAGAIGGAALTPDGEVLFTAVRHPGAEPGARFERPGTRWPEFAPGVPPRSALLGFQRAAGGPVGG